MRVVNRGGWVSVFQPGSGTTSNKKQQECAALLREVLLQRFHTNIPQDQLAAFVARHLSKTESFAVSVQ
jgi:hypothetical protein